ncbi:MAG TPA: hypothetical protein VG146_07205 [Verrucomicrobiae bacterium]|nr:hypothetical protein [Verrucomicrobiae bacterium]
MSDIHYASAAEQARGSDYELAGIHNPLLRLVVRLYRHYFWLREPLCQNHLLEAFLNRPESFDLIVANGDYSCDSASLGLSDDATCQSARECLGKLRQRFGNRLEVNFGDHELGKVSLFGGRGGMRLESWRRAREELNLSPFWQRTVGAYVLIGVTSSLVALPVFEPDTLASERSEWERLRAEHMNLIRKAFAAIPARGRVLLFCHDPSALPFLAGEPEVAARLPQIEETIIGHLHSNLILWKSRLLAGMPRLTFLGHTATRLSSALRQARQWRPFRVRLCPSLAGIELLKDGGYLTAELDLEARKPALFTRQYLPRTKN